MAQQTPNHGLSDRIPQAQAPGTLQLKDFWPNVTSQVKALTQADLRTQELPLARIKKIMKLDEDVKMISAEAPVLFAKAAEIFIHELTLRAWIHTEDNKRRTLQRNDIAMAISKYDQFDFLIDIVPRDEIKPTKKEDKASGVFGPEQVQYYLQLAQQHQQALQQATTGGVQIIQPSVASGVQTIQLVQSGTAAPAVVQPTPQIMTQAAQPVQVQIAGPQQTQVQPSQQTATASGGTSGLQIVHHIMGADGQVQHVPIQLSANQLQMLRMQLQGNQSTSSPIIIQTGSAPTSTATVMSPSSQNGTQIIQNS